MTTRQQVEDFIVREFDFLRERFGYSAPLVTRNDWLTRVDYAKGDVGIELELDWREHDVFLLAVRLDNGRLPDGYYVADGRKCRKHLANVVRERKWSVSVPKPSPPGAVPLGPDGLKDAALEYKELLLACLNLLEAEWRALWEEAPGEPRPRGPRAPLA